MQGGGSGNGDATRDHDHRPVGGGAQPRHDGPVGTSLTRGLADDVGLRRSLERFLLRGAAVGAFFAASSATAGVTFQDPRIVITGAVWTAGALGFIVARRLVRRGVMRGALALAASCLFFAGLAVAALQPVYPVLAVLPLIAVGVALPVTRGRALARLIVAAWSATIVIGFVLEFSDYELVAPSWYAPTFRVLGLAAAMGIFLFLLWQFSERLHLALAEARVAGEARETSETRYRTLVERLPGVVYVAEAGRHGRWHYVSAQIEHLLGFPPRAWLDDPGLWARQIHPDDRDRVLADSPAPADGEPAVTEYRLTTADGRAVWVRDYEAVIGRSGSGADLVQGVMVDISDAKRLEEELAHHAFHDPLTGLPNRLLFMDRLQLAVARAARAGRRVGVIYLDLDDFKVINDTLGHGAGDRLLVEVAHRLAVAVRTIDTVSRPGGDEFTVLIDDVSNEATIDEVAERIATSLAAPFTISQREVTITVSMGIATLGDGTRAPDELVAQADAALYEAKSRGKARHERFDPAMTARAWARLEIEADVRRGLERQEFRVHYQPVVDLRTGRIDELEALVRWERPGRGLVMPSEFVPTAEESGLIVPLGRFVLEEACRATRAWQLELQAAANIAVSVNLSARQFRAAGLVDTVSEVLATTGLPAASLKLEITETAMMLDVDLTAATVAGLRALGVRLLLDDFGTGYSALNYLKRFPVDGLKIDRSFVAGIGRDAEDRAIVQAAIAFARALDLEVTGEGIETERQLRQLRDLGCDRGQGYLFARPVPGDQVPSLLRSGVPLAVQRRLRAAR